MQKHTWGQEQMTACLEVITHPCSHLPGHIYTCGYTYTYIHAHRQPLGTHPAGSQRHCLAGLADTPLAWGQLLLSNVPLPERRHRAGAPFTARAHPQTGDCSLQIQRDLLVIFNNHRRPNGL